MNLEKSINSFRLVEAKSGCHCFVSILFVGAEYPGFKGTVVIGLFIDDSSPSTMGFKSRLTSKSMRKIARYCTGLRCYDISVIHLETV